MRDRNIDLLRTIDLIGIILVHTQPNDTLKQFHMPSFGVMKKSMKNARIIDDSNIYDAKELANAGFEYKSIGNEVRQTVD